MKYTCPISKSLIDENVVRLMGFFTLILVTTAFFNYKISWIIFLFLTYDFLARISKPKYSIIKIISKKIMHEIIKIKPKEIGSAPKIFAAKIGLGFSIILFLLSLTNDNTIVINNLLESYTFSYILWKILIIIFIIAISLETFFSFCLGCKAYSWLQYFKNKIK